MCKFLAFRRIFSAILLKLHSTFPEEKFGDGYFLENFGFFNHFRTLSAKIGLLGDNYAAGLSKQLSTCPGEHFEENETFLKTHHYRTLSKKFWA